MSSYFQTQAKHEQAMYKNIKALALLFPGLIIPQKRREDDDQGEGEKKKKKKRKRGPYRLARVQREILDNAVVD